MKKRVMILGAGIYQVPLIKKAKELNLETIVVSPKGKYPGINIADIFVDLDTRDVNAILEKAIKYKINAILTTGTDVATPTIGFVNDKLNLKGTSYSAAAKSMDKILMKKALQDHGVNTATFSVIDNYNDLIFEAEKIGFPVIVKATDSSGSRGITKAENIEELQTAWENSRNATSKNDIIIEKYLTGIEIGAQAIIKGDKVVNIFIHSDETTPPPICVPIGHAIPLNISKKLTLKINDLIENAIKAIGIRDTISNIDIMIVNNEPYIIELASRMGATCLAENISIFGGFDAYEIILKLALGDNFKISEYKEQANAAILLKSEKTGIIKKIDFDTVIYDDPNLFDLSFDVKVGDRVNKFTVGPDRIGQIITIGQNVEEALDLAYKIQNSIVIEVSNE